MYYYYKCYPVPDGVMGWIEEEKRYRKFASESDYREYVEG
jgi:hypothetical protein